MRYTLSPAKNMPELRIDYSIMILNSWRRLECILAINDGKFIPIINKSDEKLTPKPFSFRKPLYGFQ